MEQSLRRNALIAVMVFIIAAAGNSVVMAQIPSSGCSTSLLTGLTPCINFFNASNGISPPQGCCTAFASVVETSASCICQLFSFMATNPSPIPVPSAFPPINQTQALNLPGACNITNSQCSGSGVAPTTSPDVSGTTTVTDGPSTLPSEAPSADSPSTPTVNGSSPSSPLPASDAKALFAPSFFSVCCGVILGSLLW